MVALLTALINTRITIFCNYRGTSGSEGFTGIGYVGVLQSISEDGTAIVLSDPGMLFESGAFGDEDFADLQPMGVSTWVLPMDSIKSVGVMHNS